MIRHVILASLLALVGSCIDQGQPANLGTADQDLSLGTVPLYSNVVPVPWSARLISNSDYWDPSIVGGVPNLQMVAFVVNGEAPTYDANGNIIDPATRMVWLVSNARVYKVYEVYVADVAQMTQMTRNAFTVVENGFAAQGYSAPGSSIIVGVDGGVTGGGIKGGGPPHGFPYAVVRGMYDNAAAVRNVIVAIPNIGANSLQ